MSSSESLWNEICFYSNLDCDWKKFFFLKLSEESSSLSNQSGPDEVRQGFVKKITVIK